VAPPLLIDLHRARIQGPPAATPVTSVVAGTPLPAGPAAVAHRCRWTHRRDQNACFHVKIDRFDNGFVDSLRRSETTHGYVRRAIKIGRTSASRLSRPIFRTEARNTPNLSVGGSGNPSWQAVRGVPVLAAGPFQRRTRYFPRHGFAQVARTRLPSAGDRHGPLFPWGSWRPNQQDEHVDPAPKTIAASRV
jgi:hypothetical protein